MHGWWGMGGSAFTIHAEKQVSFAFAVSFFDIFNSGSSMSRRLGNAVLACEAARRALVRDMQDSNRPMIMERK